MHTIVVNQWPDRGNALRDVLLDLVKDTRLGLRSARFLVAYVSENGLSEMSAILAVLQKRKGTVSAILGFDPRMTTESALRKAMKLFPRPSLKIMGASNCSFHPKVYLFGGKRHLLAVFGSHNMTAGGLVHNWEASVVLLLDRSLDAAAVDEIEDLWDSYQAYAGPLKKSPSSAWLRQQAGRLRKVRQAVAQASAKIKSPFGRANRTRRRRSKRALLPRAGSKAPTTLLPRTLLLQVLRETGAGGTQVQIPVAALEEYFGIDRGVSIPVTVRLDGDDHRATILHFPNNTHRIQMSFLEGQKRPLMLVLKRIPSNRDLYSGTIAAGTSSRYKKLLKRCERQTRSGSKMYGFLD